ncbi:hypothetical protein [Halovenus marina]|uniref:hypothetical protein n=1 Tax=Halovenus marina TaxID=3396621 RepID=UPI003F55CB06
MPSRRRFLTTIGVSTAVAMCGCTGVFTSDDDDGDEKVPGPKYPSGTLWVSNTAVADLSVTVTTVDHSQTFEKVVPSGEIEIREAFVSASTGTTVTLNARVESFAEGGISYSFMPSGGGSESETPPQYARLHVPGSDGEVNWQSREASDSQVET